MLCNYLGVELFFELGIAVLERESFLLCVPQGA